MTTGGSAGRDPNGLALRRSSEPARLTFWLVEALQVALTQGHWVVIRALTGIRLLMRKGAHPAARRRRLLTNTADHVVLPAITTSASTAPEVAMTDGDAFTTASC